MRNDHAPHSARLAVIVPASFMNSVATGLMGLGMLFVIKEVYHAPASVVGVFGALWSVCYFAGCILLAKPVSRLVPRFCMTAGLAVTIAAFLGFLAFPGIVTAFAAYAVFGFATALFWPPVMGWLSRGVEGKELSVAQSAFNFAWSSGGILSPFLAGFLSERGKFLPVWVSVAIMAVTAFFVAASRALYRDEHERPDESSSGHHSSIADNSTPLRFPAWVGVFAIYAVMGVVFNIFPVYARDELGLSESATGGVLSMRAIFTMAGFILLGRFTGWHGRVAFIPGAVAAVVFVMAVLVVWPPLSVCAFPIVGLLMSGSYTASLFYGVSGAADRDRRVTIHEALLTAGQILGSVAGGFLYQAFTMRIVFVFLGAALTIAALAQVAMLRKPDGR